LVGPEPANATPLWSGHRRSAWRGDRELPVVPWPGRAAARGDACADHRATGRLPDRQRQSLPVVRAVPHRYEDRSEIDQSADRLRRRELRELPLASERLYQHQSTPPSCRSDSASTATCLGCHSDGGMATSFKPSLLPYDLDGHPRPGRAGRARTRSHPLRELSHRCGQPRLLTDRLHDLPLATGDGDAAHSRGGSEFHDA